MGNYAMLLNFLIPMNDEDKQGKTTKVWYIHFDGACSKFGKGVGVVFTSP